MANEQASLHEARPEAERRDAGCIHCDGPVAAVYPEGAWRAGLDSSGLSSGIKAVMDLPIGSNPLAG